MPLGRTSLPLKSEKHERHQLHSIRRRRPLTPQRARASSPLWTAAWTSKLFTLVLSHVSGLEGPLYGNDRARVGPYQMFDNVGNETTR